MKPAFSNPGEESSLDPHASALAVVSMANAMSDRDGELMYGPRFIIIDESASHWHHFVVADRLWQVKRDVLELVWVQEQSLYDSLP